MRTLDLRTLSAAALACLALSVHAGLDWERRLTILPRGRDIGRAQSSGGGSSYTGASQRIAQEGDSVKASYGFVNFNKDRLSVAFSLPKAEYRRYLSGYGYRDEELEDIRAWRERERQRVWGPAWQKGGQAEGEKALKAVEWEYNLRMSTFLSSRGLALKDNNIYSDIPGIVKKNAPVVKPLALAFSGMAESRSYSQEDTIGAVLSMVQTALSYKIPPLVENGLHTGGVLPPARALLSGWGDCDTKTALAASILNNWNGMRLVGVAVPGHYLMAIRRLPGKGDVFVRHQGLEYVLIEPAGPAWLEPGAVGKNTTALLESGEGFELEPFF